MIKLIFTQLRSCSLFPICVLPICVVMFAFSGCSVFGIRSQYEQPNYELLDQVNEVEIRQYEPRLAAETNSAKDDREAFMTLFRYIGGANTGDEKVSMTAPVQVDRSATTVAMTTPVETSTGPEGGVRMRFFLPRSFSRKSAPQPTDSRVKIIELPREIFAVLTYSGSGSKSSFDRKKNDLLRVITGSRWTPASEPTYFGYDPPFTIPFLRKNEVALRVIPPA